MKLLYVFCVFQYGQLAKRFCRSIADPSSSRPPLLCCGFVLANSICSVFSGFVRTNQITGNRIQKWIYPGLLVA